MKKASSFLRLLSSAFPLSRGESPPSARAFSASPALPFLFPMFPPLANSTGSSSTRSTPATTARTPPTNIFFSPAASALHLSKTPHRRPPT